VDRIMKIKTVTRKPLFVTSMTGNAVLARVKLLVIPGYAKTEAWDTDKPGVVAVKYWNASEHGNAVYFILTYEKNEDQHISERSVREPAAL